ncbi:hypothetical protein T265_13228, partial [Opisthorchis viverrini]
MNVLVFMDSLTQAKHEGLISGAILFDFSKAFDRFQHVPLFHKLESYGIQGRILRWIKAFQSDRSSRARIGLNYSSPAPVSIGVPRGSVLGPLLFLVYVNDLPDVLASTCLLFADDLKYWTYNASALQMDVDAANQWSLHWHLPLNDKKCVHMSFGGDSMNVLVMNGEKGPENIMRVDAKTDLGISVFSSLSFSLHHEKLAPKTFAILQIIRRTFSCVTRMDFQILYGAYGRPLLEYANKVFHSIRTKDVTLIERVHRAAMRLFASLKFMNHETLLAMLDFFPLEFSRLRGDLILTYVLCEQKFDHLYDPSLVARVPVECPPEPEFRRRKPRFTEWCAPEVDNFQYNDRSDLWSLACMMQIMLNVKDLTADDMNWALQTLKSNPKSFFPLNNQSTDDEVKFVKILNSMLEPDPEKRMSLEQLVQDPFVEAILEQADPESLARANRCIVRMADRECPFILFRFCLSGNEFLRTTSKIPSLVIQPETPMGVSLLPAEDGERAVRDYLIRNWRHENCVEGAVIWFAEHCCHSNAGLPPHLSGVLFNVLDLHKANAKLVHNTLIVLNHCVYLRYTVIELPSPSTESRTAENDQNEAKEFKYSLENEDFVIILNAMKQHPQDQVIQEAALKLLDSLLGASHSNVDVEVVRNYLATRQHVFDHLIKIGLITYLLELLQSHMYELARLGAEYLWKYCFYAPIARMVGESKALITVLYLMRNYPEDIKLFTGGPLLILALSSCETVRKKLLATSDVVPILLQGLDRFSNCPDTIWNICLGLNVVINLSEHFALHFVGIDGETEYQTDGCGLLHALYRTYHDSTAIIEGLMRVINAVMQYDVIGLYKYEFHRNLPDIERRISMPFASDDIVVVRMSGKKFIKSMLKEISTRFREHK